MAKQYACTLLFSLILAIAGDADPSAVDEDLSVPLPSLLVHQGNPAAWGLAPPTATTGGGVPSLHSTTDTRRSAQLRRQEQAVRMQQQQQGSEEVMTDFVEAVGIFTTFVSTSVWGPKNPSQCEIELPYAAGILQRSEEQLRVLTLTYKKQMDIRGAHRNCTQVSHKASQAAKRQDNELYFILQTNKELEKQVRESEISEARVELGFQAGALVLVFLSGCSFVLLCRHVKSVKAGARNCGRLEAKYVHAVELLLVDHRRASESAIVYATRALEDGTRMNINEEESCVRTDLWKQLRFFAPAVSGPLSRRNFSVAVP